MPAKVARADWTCPRALITARKISSSGIATYPTSNGSPEAPPPSGHVGVVVAPLDHQQSKLRGVHAVAWVGAARPRSERMPSPGAQASRARSSGQVTVTTKITPTAGGRLHGRRGPRSSLCRSPPAEQQTSLADYARVRGLWAARLRGIVQPSAPSNVIGAAQVRGGSPPGAFNGAAQSLG